MQLGQLLASDDREALSLLYDELTRMGVGAADDDAFADDDDDDDDDDDRRRRLAGREPFVCAPARRAAGATRGGAPLRADYRARDQRDDK